MNGIYILLAVLAVIGFLPLAIILYKRNRVRKILTTGHLAKARVYRVYTVSRQPSDIVYYTYYDQGKRQFYGQLTCRSGLYNENDILDVYYDAANPKRSTVQGAWKSKIILAFGIGVAAFVVFAVYKLYGMIQSGAL